MRKTKTDFDNEVNVEIARQEYDLHLIDLRIEQKEYIKRLNKNIKLYARRGFGSICTPDSNREIMTTEFMNHLKEYYEARGFTVTEESSTTGLITTWLRISWLG